MSSRSEQPAVENAVMVLGMGATGASCARYLARKAMPGIFADSRVAPTGSEAIRNTLPDAELHTGKIPEQVPPGLSRLIVSPGVSLDEPLIRNARAMGIPVESDIDLFIGECDGPVIGVTGSNGKSTVTSMIAAILIAGGYDVASGGNLGTPALDLLGEGAGIYLLELSSFQLERSREIPTTAAVILNIEPDHLDQHGTMASYIDAKARIYRGSKTAVVNRDLPAVSALAPDGVPQISFGLDAPEAGHWGVHPTATGDFIARGAIDIMRTDELIVPGRHNLANALAALAIADVLDVPAAAMVDGLRSYRGLPHRMQTIPTADGIRWINDSKATNEAAAVASIRSLDGPLVLIAGGDSKGADFKQLANILGGRDCTVVLLGRDAERIANALSGVCEFKHADDLEHAVRIAAKLSAPGGTVLLAPACSSHDMFADFAERGDRFETAVRELQR